MLYSYILEAQNGNEKFIIIILEKFKPLIHKYSRKLHYEDAESDLICFFMELIKRFPLSRFEINNEGGIVSYINISIKNHYSWLIKELISKRSIVVFSDLSEQQLYHIECTTAFFDTYSYIDFEVFKNILNDRELNIILLIFVEGYSSAEIARTHHISRQAVNQIKKKAISKIKRVYFPEVK